MIGLVSRENSARCWIHGRWVELGPWDSHESKAEHARILAELAASPAAHLKTASNPTVNTVLAAFWLHAEQHYRHADGRPTGEPGQYRQAFAIVRKMVRFGATTASLGVKLASASRWPSGTSPGCVSIPR